MPDEGAKKAPPPRRKPDSNGINASGNVRFVAFLRCVTNQQFRDGLRRTLHPKLSHQFAKQWALEQRLKGTSCDYIYIFLFSLRTNRTRLAIDLFVCTRSTGDKVAPQRPGMPLWLRSERSMYTDEPLSQYCVISSCSPSSDRRCQAQVSSGPKEGSRGWSGKRRRLFVSDQFSNAGNQEHAKGPNLVSNL